MPVHTAAALASGSGYPFKLSPGMSSSGYPIKLSPGMSTKASLHAFSDDSDMGKTRALTSSTFGQFCVEGA